jgi:hypothetical protein
MSAKEPSAKVKRTRPRITQPLMQAVGHNDTVRSPKVPLTLRLTVHGRPSVNWRSTTLRSRTDRKPRLPACTPESSAVGRRTDHPSSWQHRTTIIAADPCVYGARRLLIGMQARSSVGMPIPKTSGGQLPLALSANPKRELMDALHEASVH